MIHSASLDLPPPPAGRSHAPHPFRGRRPCVDDSLGKPRSCVPRPVPDAAYSDDHLGVLGILLDLGTQPLHVHVHQPGVGRVPISPHLLQQHLAGEHLARLAGQGDQQVELQRGERDLFAVPGDLVPGYVDVHVGHPQPLGRADIGAPQPSPDPGGELLGLERLHHVVVGARLQAQHHVDGVGLRGEHDDRDAGLTPDLLAHVQPGHPRQHQVQQDQVRVHVPERLECLRPVPDDGGVEALPAQHDGQHLGESGVVVDHQHTCFHAVHGDILHRWAGADALGRARFAGAGPGGGRSSEAIRPAARACDDGAVSVPGYPRPDPHDGPPDGWLAAQPGPIPLRPLNVGAILAVAVTVVRRNMLPLCLAAFAVAALSSAATVGVLAAAGSLRSYAEATWLADLLQGGTSVPASILVSALAGLMVSLIGAQAVAGMATAYAGALAQGRDGRGAVSERLGGRWPALLGVSVIVGVLVAVGLMLLVVPGVLAYLVMALAASVVAMERSGVAESLKRSVVLSRGHRGRIFGALVLALLIGTIGGAVVTTVASAPFGQQDAVAALLITQGIGAVVGAFTGAWTGAVVALLYIDVRIRSERLDYALRVAAASDRQRARQHPGGGFNPPPAPA